MKSFIGSNDVSLCLGLLSQNVRKDHIPLCNLPGSLLVENQGCGGRGSAPLGNRQQQQSPFLRLVDKDTFTAFL